MLEAILAINAAVMGVILWRLWRLPKPTALTMMSSPPNIFPQVDTRPIEKLLEGLPSQITTAVTNSGNTHKGRLGELIGYISIKADYDRIIPLGNIVDFVGISFPTGTNPGYIEFIDVKTGDGARLNKDQQLLKKIILSGNVKFKTVKIDTIDTLNEHIESESTTD